MHSDLNDLGADGGGLGNLYSDALMMAGIGPWACDLRTGKLSWTPTVFDMFGLPSNKRIDRREIVSMYAEPHRFVLERLRSAAIANCGTFSLEALILRPDGAER
jgi:PAS domain-containing protein